MQLILVERFLGACTCLVYLNGFGIGFSFMFGDNTLFGQLVILVLSPLFLFSILLGLFRLSDDGYRCKCILRNASGVLSVGTLFLNTTWDIVRWLCAIVGEASLAGVF